MIYSFLNVTRGNREDGENPGYFYAPCEVCGKRMNVGNYPPVIPPNNHILREKLNGLAFYVRCPNHR